MTFQPREAHIWSYRNPSAGPSAGSSAGPNAGPSFLENFRKKSMFAIFSHSLRQRLAKNGRQLHRMIKDNLPGPKRKIQHKQ